MVAEISKMRLEELEPATPARGVGTGSSGNPSHTLGGSDVPIGIVNVLINGFTVECQ
jgi:hypothetical protein